jgi:tripartite-type tricarboxylate transporter receptor subunit TctC
MIESGFPGLSLFFWSGLLAPAGTPPEIVSRLNAATNAALRSPQMKSSMERLGIDAVIGSAADFAAFISDEQAKWARIVEAADD